MSYRVAPIPPIDFLLVDSVKNSPCIWKTSDQNFKDPIAMQKAWEQIASIQRLDVSYCQDLWKTLRSRYVKTRKQMKENPHYEKTWSLYDELDFLDPHIKIRRSKSKMARKPTTEQIDSQLSGLDPSIEVPITIKTEPLVDEVKSLSSDGAPDNTSVEFPLTKPNVCKSGKYEDEDYYFALSLGSSLKLVKSAKRRAMLKAKFFMQVAEELNSDEENQCC